MKEPSGASGTICATSAELKAMYNYPGDAKATIRNLLIFCNELYGPASYSLSPKPKSPDQSLREYESQNPDFGIHSTGVDYLLANPGRFTTADWVSEDEAEQEIEDVRKIQRFRLWLTVFSQKVDELIDMNEICEDLEEFQEDLDEYIKRLTKFEAIFRKFQQTLNQESIQEHSSDT
ncbi:hypothetical protein TWF481_003126 [Arthrobotrys musiformis]|uniref:Uncharacterized protein n=1 Tax=Arthrobotrys musiformis TaxID=47236 RepID=A0AAV9VPM0_9PEZI